MTPSVGLGLPKKPQDYDLLTIDGVTVYWPRGLDTPYSLTIEQHSFFGYKTLHLEGWKLI